MKYDNQPNKEKPTVKPRRLAGLLALLVPAALLLPAVPAGASSAPLFKDLPASIQQSKVITVGTSVAYPPFDYNTATNSTVIGFEPDLRAAIAKLLGVTFKTDIVTFQELVPGIQSNRFQVAMDGISDTTAREKIIDFVDYGATGNVILTTAANAKQVSSNVESLCGKEVATAQGTEGGITPAQITTICQAAGKPAAKNEVFPNSTDDLLAVQSGRVFSELQTTATGGYDALSSKGVITSTPLKEYDSGKFVPDVFGVAVTKGDTQLEKAFKAAFNEIIANGTYAKILKKWDVSALAVKQSTIDTPSS